MMPKRIYATEAERAAALREANKQWYKDHPLSEAEPEDWLRRKKNNRRAYVNQVLRNVTIINKFKDVPCMDCNNRFPPECMDFDHVRGEKLFGIGTQGKKLSSKKTDILLDEIAKCDVVCACCHRIRTRKRLLEERKLLDIADGLITEEGENLQ